VSTTPLSQDFQTIDELIHALQQLQPGERIDKNGISKKKKKKETKGWYDST